MLQTSYKCIFSCYVLIFFYCTSTCAQNLPDQLHRRPLPLSTLSTDTAKVNTIYRLTKYYMSRPGKGPGNLKIALSYCEKGITLAENQWYENGQEVGFTLKLQILLRQLASARDTAKAKVLFRISSHYLYETAPGEKNIKRALFYNQEATDLSRKLNYPFGEVASNLLSSMICWKKFDVQRAGNYSQKAVLLLKNKYAGRFSQFDYLELAGLIDRTDDVQENELELLYTATIKTDTNKEVSVAQRADVLAKLGYIYVLKNQLPLALATMKEAYKIYQLAKLPLSPEYYRNVFVVYIQMNKRGAALSNILLSLTASKRSQDKKHAFAAYTSLALFYDQAKMPAKRILYLEQALALARDKKNPNEATWTRAVLGSAYTTTHQYKKAFDVLNDGIKYGSVTDPIYILLHIGLIEYYTATRNFTAASRLYPIMMSEIKNIPADWYIPARAHFAAINFFLASKQFTRTSLHFKALSVFHNNPMFLDNETIVELLKFKVDSAQGRYLRAIADYQQYNALINKLNNQTHNKEVVQLEVAYDTEKKDQEIAFKANNIHMLTRQTQMQQKMLRTQLFAKNMLFASVGLLTLLLGLIYNRYHLKQRANSELSDRQEEINQQNESLTSLLEEREWLLKEIHHRVKNNLQIIISLLNTQSAYLSDEGMLEVIQESKNRMHAISLIHQKLYQGDSLSGVNMHNYIHELTGFLQDNLHTSDRIAFVLKIDNVVLDVSQAVPLGLILNEAITNSIKYAFKHQEEGLIRITLMLEPQESIFLRIEDNGSGLPEGFDVESLTSLGMSLMKGLSKQLGGNLQLRNEGGLCIELRLDMGKMLNSETRM